VKLGTIDAPPIDQNKNSAGEAALKAPDAHCPLDAIDLRNLHAGREPKSFGKAGNAGAADILLGDDIDCGRGLRHCHRRLGDRGNFDVAELFQAQAPETVLEVCAGLLGGAGKCTE